MIKCISCGEKLTGKDLKYREGGEHRDNARCIKCKAKLKKNEGDKVS